MASGWRVRISAGPAWFSVFFLSIMCKQFETFVDVCLKMFKSRMIGIVCFVCKYRLMRHFVMDVYINFFLFSGGGRGQDPSGADRKTIILLSSQQATKMN